MVDGMDVCVWMWCGVVGLCETVMRVSGSRRKRERERELAGCSGLILRLRPTLRVRQDYLNYEHTGFGAKQLQYVCVCMVVSD